MSLDVGNPAVRLTTAIAAHHRDLVRGRAHSVERASECERLLEAVTLEDARRVRARRWLGRVLAGVAIGVTAAVAASFGLETRANGGGSEREMSWFAATTSGLALPLVPGATAELRPHSRARVLSVSDDRLRLSLESGLVVSHFAQFEGSFQWEAGPHSISGSGAEFVLSWDAVGERLEVSVIRGMVTVGGATSPPQVVLADQSLALGP